VSPSVEFKPAIDSILCALSFVFAPLREKQFSLEAQRKKYQRRKGVNGF
jgi:hypothetical protein